MRFIIFVLVIVQIVFAILGFGRVVDWSFWVLISPTLILLGGFLFLMFCGIVNVVTPTHEPISSDTLRINDETSAIWIAQMIQQGNCTLDMVAPEDRAEVGFHLKST